jgi:hypothetical protein
MLLRQIECLEGGGCLGAEGAYGGEDALGFAKCALECWAPLKKM